MEDKRKAGKINPKVSQNRSSKFTFTIFIVLNNDLHSNFCRQLSNTVSKPCSINKILYPKQLLNPKLGVFTKPHDPTKTKRNIYNKQER